MTGVYIYIIYIYTQIKTLDLCCEEHMLIKGCFCDIVTHAGSLDFCITC